ncbi:hypothetical protein [Sphingomonas sp. MA1305]|uniref:hypothetical protein n=1 Tax=Sphingomonas sp. MA1305 TaxID=2479204 RepID=UPI0018DFE0C4|nr:hypothetical protein [Sphingomonas sp. MA1305]
MASEKQTGDPVEDSPKPKVRRKKAESSQSETSYPDNQASQEAPSSSPKPRRGRSARPFPAGPFEEALQFSKEIYDFGSGQPVRRLSLFDHLQRMPDSGTSRQLITNSNKYGLVKGNFNSDQLELSEDGRRICDDMTSPREKAKLRAKLAINDIQPFDAIYRKLVNSKLPARAALIDGMKDNGVEGEYLEEGVDTFIVNMKASGLLQTLSGAERVVPIEHLLDTLPGTTIHASVAQTSANPLATSLVTQEQAGFDTTCFYVTPIGEAESEQRKHSNLFLENIVEPAIRTLGLSVVRADQIDKPGMIGRQIMEYLFRSRLVVADLSFHNANVFYELALRHLARLPIVQVIRYGDPIPFDINQMRTVVLDNRDIYSLLPNVDLYRSEIASQARRAMEAGSEVDTPISIYFPQAKLML